MKLYAVSTALACSGTSLLVTDIPSMFFYILFMSSPTYTVLLTGRDGLKFRSFIMILK